MDAIISYFTALQGLRTHRAAYIFGGLFLFFVIENSIPLFKTVYSKARHTALNLFFTFTTIIINMLMAFILVWATLWVEQNQFGILHWIGYSNLLAISLGLMLMDFIGAWSAHYVEHHVKWMWQFHVVHHTDQNVDTTTANRHHPGESVIRFVFTTVAVIVVGAPVWLVFLYQTLSVVLTQFNHMNVKMPSWLDATLRLVICTPNMHRVHHHYRQPYSDTNFGNIFSFWDRIFGTYVIVDNSKLKYGVDTYMADKEANDVLTLLKIPFAGYREPVKYEEEEKL